MSDDTPPCNVQNQGETCYCTNRPGCPYDGGDDFPGAFPNARRL